MSKEWTILVAGGRDFDDLMMIEAVMGKAIRHCLALDPTRKIRFIQGGAKGADFLCKCLAKKYGYECDQYDADWDTHGRGAGNIRNKQMLDEGRPDFVVIMPGGRGTSDMFHQATQAGLRIFDSRDAK